METTTNAFHQLAGHNFMSLTTFRKSGQPMPTPVWFAQVDDKIYMMTQPQAGKIKRIRNNAQVEVAPCDMRGTLLGDSVEAMACILPPNESAPARKAMNKKYGWQKRLFDLMVRVRRSEEVYIEITPM